MKKTLTRLTALTLACAIGSATANETLTASDAERAASAAAEAVIQRDQISDPAAQRQILLDMRHVYDGGNNDTVPHKALSITVAMMAVVHLHLS